MAKSDLDKYRKAAWGLWAMMVVIAGIGWLLLDRDPAAMTGIIAAVGAGPLIAEGANVGKRATYRRDHHELPPVEGQ